MCSLTPENEIPDVKSASGIFIISVCTPSPVIGSPTGVLREGDGGEGVDNIAPIQWLTALKYSLLSGAEMSGSRDGLGMGGKIFESNT